MNVIINVVSIHTPKTNINANETTNLITTSSSIVKQQQQQQPQLQHHQQQLQDLKRLAVTTTTTTTTTDYGYYCYYSSLNTTIQTQSDWKNIIINNNNNNDCYSRTQKTPTINTIMLKMMNMFRYKSSYMTLFNPISENHQEQQQPEHDTDNNDEDDSYCTSTTTLPKKSMMDHTCYDCNNIDNDDGVVDTGCIDPNCHYTNDHHTEQWLVCGTCTCPKWICMILIGQVLAVVLATGGAAQGALSNNCSISVPTISVGLVYLCLTIVSFISMYIVEQQRQQRQQKQHDISQTQFDTIVDDEDDDENNNKHQSGLENNDNLGMENIDRIVSSSNDTFLRSTSTTTSSNTTSSVSSTERYSFDTTEYNENVNNKNTILCQQQQQQLERNDTMTVVVVESSSIWKQQYQWYQFYILYLLAAFLDVLANYCTVMAFQYTTITSVTLLDALAIPSSMILSRLFLNRTYNCIHLLGILICMIGICINVLYDSTVTIADSSSSSSNVTNDTTTTATDDDDDDHNTYNSRRLYGDFLAMVGGTLFGAVNVIGEVAVQYKDRNHQHQHHGSWGNRWFGLGNGGPNEYIGMIGLFGTILCIIQLVVWTGRDEIIQLLQNNGHDDVSTTCTVSMQYMYLFGFVVSSCSVYIGSSRFLQYSEAAFLNLNLLTADLWSVVLSITALNIVPQGLYFYIAVTCTMLGVILYEMGTTFFLW